MRIVLTTKYMASKIKLNGVGIARHKTHTSLIDLHLFVKTHLFILLY